MVVERRPGSLSVRARVLLRQLQAAPSAVVSVFMVVLLIALFVTATPRVFERVAEEDLLETIETADSARRNIEIRRSTRIGFGADDQFVHVDRRGEQLMETEMTPTVVGIIDGTQFVVDMPRYKVLSFPAGVEGPFPTTFVYRYQEGIEEHMTLVSGRMPREHDPIPMFDGPECPEDVLDTEGYVVSSDVECRIDDVPVFEAVVSASTAEAMMLDVGDMALLRPDGTDIAFSTASSFQLQERVVLHLTGLVEFSDLSDEFWFADNVLHEPRITENPDFRLVGATGVMDPNQYMDMLRSIPFVDRRYSWRYFVAADAVKEAPLETLSNDVAQLSQLSEYTVSSQLPELLSEYTEQRQLTVELMSISVASLVAVALGAVLLLSTLIAVRQRWSTVQIRNRGASGGQLVLTSVYRGLLLVVPGVIVGYAVSASLVPGSQSLASLRAAFALGAVAIAAVTLAALPLIRSRLGAIQKDDFWPGASAARRIVLEVLVVVAAVGSGLILRRRGLSDEPLLRRGIDALSAFAPAVIGLGVAVITIRLYRPLIVGLSWLGSRARSLVPFVGLKRVLGQHGSSWVSLAVILVAVGVAVFSLIARTSIAIGQVDHGWHIAGADYRVNAHERGVGLPDPDAVVEFAGFRAVAVGTEIADITFVGSGLTADAFVLAVDVDDYRDVVDGSPATIILPAPVSELGSEDLGTAANPIPAVISENWSRDGSPEVGALVEMEVGQVNPVIRVDAIVESHPSMPTTQPFVIIDRRALAQVIGELAVHPSVVYAEASSTALAALEDHLGGISPTIRLTSRHELTSDLADDPFVRLVDSGLLVVMVTATALAVATALASTALASARRRKDVGYLGTMGLTSRQATALTILEQVPPVVVAACVGIGLGVGVTRLLAAIMPLDSYTGSLLPTELQVDPVALLLVSGALLASVMVAVVGFVLTTRDDQGQILRVGDE
jgi:hypothetical protein